MASSTSVDMLPTEERTLQQDDKATWQSHAYQEQQGWLGKLGDRDCDYLEFSKLRPLQMKVGFALYSHPTQCSHTSLYESEKNQYVTKMCDKIHELAHEILADGVYFSVLYTYCYIQESKILFKKKEAEMFQNVIFKIRKGRYSQEEYFIDSNLRVYCSWESFKKNNAYPKCWYALPRDGKYRCDSSGRVLLDVEQSPACSLKSKILDVVDIGGIVLGVGGVVGSFVFPPASPLLIGSLVASGASGVFTGGRAIVKLTDRQKHKQSLKDREAALLWLELSLSAVTVGTSGFSIFKSVRAARAITSAGEAAIATSAGEQVACVATETVSSGQVAIKSTKSASKVASRLRNVAGKGTKAIRNSSSKGAKLAKGSTRNASKLAGRGSSVGRAAKNADKGVKATQKSIKAAKALKKVMEGAAMTSTAVAEETSLLANFTQLFSDLGTRGLGLVQTPAAATTITTLALRVLFQISVDYVTSTLTVKHRELLQEILTLVTKIQSGNLEPIDITKFISFVNFYFNTLVLNHEHFIDNFLWHVYVTAGKWLRGEVSAESSADTAVSAAAESSADTAVSTTVQASAAAASEAQGPSSSSTVWDSTMTSDGNEIISNLFTDLEQANIEWGEIQLPQL